MAKLELGTEKARTDAISQQEQKLRAELESASNNHLEKQRESDARLRKLESDLSLATLSGKRDHDDLKRAMEQQRADLERRVHQLQSSLESKSQRIEGLRRMF
eukprot:c6613_g1_i1.p2 GENE.c6613_g1_i1~~c6613_g1_i1.p2  ORF type:complete len:103 (+),score=19.04 c6613_g1_i1:1141-1449(+)